MPMKKLLALAGCAIVLTFTGCNCSSKPPGQEDGGAGGGDGSTGGGSGGGTGAGMGGGSGGGGVIVDPNDLNNAFKDSDCDGLSDAEEFGNTYAGGKRTKPENPDTDGDGIKDGVEAGRTTSVDTSCGYVGDADPTTRTLPTETDSDADGIPDGTEDTNHDGRTDANETNPTNPDTDFDQIKDGVEDTNFNGVVDPGETDPRKKDSDGDQINDGIELNVTKTNPLKPDTDGDSCSDGAEDFNQNGKVDPGETNPLLATDCGPANNPDTDGDGLPNSIEDKNGNGTVEASETDPTNPDTDGDGIKDGIEDKNKNGLVDPGETNPRRKDSDCDGLLDGPTAGGFTGEDQNANGLVDTGETDPTQFDSDGDGISDGVERGIGTAQRADVVNCSNVPFDQETTTTTDPTKRDSDGDGIDDGAEDANQNGKVDPGELNPNNPTDGVGPAGQVCTAMNLRPVLFNAENNPDIQLGLPATFTEVSTMTVGGNKVGLIGYDSANQVAFVAWRQAAPSGATNPTADETALRPMINGVSALSNPTTQTFTTWDNIAALQAFYDQAGGVDIKARANALANALVGGGAGSLAGAGGVAPANFRMQVEYLHRTNAAVVVVVAIAPSAAAPANPVEKSIFSMSDVAGGSAVAQFGDAKAVQCEKFTPKTGMVDFLFVVDDSCSMSGYQAALGNAATAMAANLGASTLDYRIAMVTSSYIGTGTMRPFTTNINQFRAWLSSSACVAGACSGFAGTTCTNQNQCWVGTGGASVEQLLGSARRAVNDLSPAPAPPVPPATDPPGKFRQGATVVVVFLGDADDQSSGTNTTAADYAAYFNNTGTVANLTMNPVGAKIVVHGIVCPSNGTNMGCGEDQNVPQRHAAVITATGGIRGDINTNPSITSTINQVVNSAINAAGYKMQKPPIGASVKVALSAVTDAVACPSASNVPRSRVDGFDFDGVSRTISFFGACRPPTTGVVEAAVSYRYWIDITPNPGGNPPPCSQDTLYDPNDPDFCKGRLACDFMANVCVCPSNCGGGAPPGKVCDTNRLVCDFVCTSDCGGTCSGYQQCNTASCTCECVQTASCGVGYKFQNGAGVCGCVCDAASLNCGATYMANTNTCSCACLPNCGGCMTGEVCNPSTCSCGTDVN
jgi:hypothetical protein